MEKIIEMLLDYVEPDEEITYDTNIKYDLGMSSFDLVCFGEDLSQEFGIQLSADDFRDCDTVGKLADFIQSKSN